LRLLFELLPALDAIRQQSGNRVRTVRSCRPTAFRTARPETHLPDRVPSVASHL
jgi:hypothetical protein